MLCADALTETGIGEKCGWIVCISIICRSASDLVQLSNLFDRRTDYILGHSEDASSVQLAEDEIEQLGRWEAEVSFYQTIMQYLRLDHFGKRTTELVVETEMERCREQESLIPESDYKLAVRIKAKTSEEVQNAEH